MGSYILRRLLLIVPTLWAVITVNFFIVQVAPGGPVDQAIAKAHDITSNMAMERISATGQNEAGEASHEDQPVTARYRGARGLDPEVIAEIERQFGFDKPIHVRYFQMLWNYLTFDFGDSLFKANSVIGLMLERMPVSISLGLWTTLLVYLISIPLGVYKAVRDGSPFDHWSSAIVIFGNAIPSFLFAILLIVVFAGGSFLTVFPLRGLGVSALGEPEFWDENSRLLLALGSSPLGHADWGLRLTHPSHEKFLYERDRQAVRDDRAGQGVDRAEDIVGPCVSERHAHYHRRLSRGLHFHAVYLVGDYRNHIFPQRTWTSGL